MPRSRTIAVMTERIRLLPDPDQRKALAATLERVNRTSNAVRAAAAEARAADAKSVRPLAQAATEQSKLPAAFNRPITDRVVAALGKRGSQKFSTYQSLTLPAGALKWPSTDRVTVPTAQGKRTIPVRVDRSRGDLRAPLAGRAVTIVYANGEFDLVAAD
jgi:hypothetical protein